MRSIKDLKRASIYLIDRLYRIVPYTLSDQGVPKAELSIIFLEQNISLHELGEKALYALHKPKHTIPHPNHEERKIRLDEWLRAMKVKSWRYIVKNAKSISLDVINNQIQLSSWKPDGRGFGSSGKPERTCPDVDPEALGQAIIDTFSDCE